MPEANDIGWGYTRNFCHFHSRLDSLWIMIDTVQSQIVVHKKCIGRLPVDNDRILVSTGKM